MSITLTPEDGTGLPNANTYVSQSTADAYFADRANAAWAALSADQKASALIQATQYLDARYTFIGQTLTTTQALQWPRQPAQPNYPGIPGYPVPIYATPTDQRYVWPNRNLTQACCELAIRASTGALYQDESQQIVTSERVDVIAVTYAPRVRNGGQIRFAIVDDLLKPIIIGGQYTATVLRA